MAAQAKEARVALVTGAARGLGLEIARELGRSGARLVMVDVLDEVHEAAATFAGEGLEAWAATCDVASEEAVEQLVAGVMERHGRIDILVNNAGISPKRDGRKVPAVETSLAQWQRVLDVNLTGVFLLCRACGPLMAARGWGRIVNMASQAARTRSVIAGAAYAASKSGLVGFSRVLAGELGGKGVTVNCIAPGRIVSPMVNEAGEAANAAYLANIPVARLGVPEDVAAAVAFLASEQASFVTGAVLDVNGGHFMG
ncbi:SDR family NAD(P)-dependent oxidoreductase [Geminicoccaceae bacterium 1502E]|nr:SDR family NAD(P)-dependent oxidoreductase [Geminicoccaceae bacterium 1502E]